MTPTVLINSGPWLTVPPFGYGGIENIIATLIPQLRRRGVRVILATIGQSTIDVDEKICVFDDPQFSHLTEPYNDVVGVAAAHLQRIAAELRGRSDIDLVHDHMEVLGPSVLAAMGTDRPAVTSDLEPVGLALHERQLPVVEPADSHDAVPVADVAVVENQILGRRVVADVRDLGIRTVGHAIGG